MKFRQWLTVILVLACTMLCAAQEGPSTLQASSPLEIATFTVDVSPPLGQRVCVGFVKEFTEIEHPLLAKGVVLRDPDGVYVVCAVDYEGLCNDSYDMFRKTIAAAAGTSTSRAAVQSVHQHTAPVFDANTDRILYADRPEDLKSGLDAAETAARRIAEAVRQACDGWQRVTHVSAGQAKVDRVASNRRVPQPDGSIVARFTGQLQDAPEGLIDPWLRTITFYNGNKRLVRLHYYATHPQTTSGGRVTYDMPGIARERFEKESSVPQVYFTACGGNVTVSKYNDGSAAVRAALSERLYDGLKRAAADCDQNARQSVTRLNWRTRLVRFPLREDAKFTLTAARKVVGDSQVRFPERLRNAMLAAWIERNVAVRSANQAFAGGANTDNGAIELSAWSVANIDVLHLPGEPFVQFQLAAQKARPNRFVCIAGYGECAPWYIGEDHIYTDRGGFEQSWSFVGPCERSMHETIAALLAHSD